MAHRERAPYAAQDLKEVNKLVQALEAHKGNKTKGGGGSRMVL
jgi:tRNA ligase